MKTTTKHLAIAIVGVILSASLFQFQTEGATKAKVSAGGSNTAKSCTNVNLPLKGKTIVLDPGHGGKDVGSTGGNGTYEKDVTLLTALNVRQKLVQQGATVVMTRDADTTISLNERTAVAQSENADLFISIHFDAFQTSDVYGMTTFYYKPQDQMIAEKIHDQLFKQDLNTKDRGVRFGDYHVIRENAKPAVLLELGYISNKKEETRMQTESFQNQISTAIASGVVNSLH
ncbi:N-acetylmuramoyl-L-alanine amidase family protein [Paenibacillus albus]|uniref:N-acetylmuramoyl-L-alanine amidase n=1 Tax=Paenibacillus albus TaxID=2495582 RepID=A0A3Q8X821_9BACL|nr:N-acetylmuramoyl-L-alanine amidase [Paenibacillus albus]AZN42585.1 N-acetylmuramoyl-L-alanine amidase [Paenibacillus albus]